MSTKKEPYSVNRSNECEVSILKSVGFEYYC